MVFNLICHCNAYTFCQWEIVCSFLGHLHANLYNCYNTLFAIVYSC